MKDNVKQIIKKMLYKVLIIALPVIIVVTIIVVGGMYILTIDDGVWDSNENSPRTYKNNVKITGNGIEVDINNVLDEALINAGYSSEDISKIKTDLEGQGYSGTSLEDKIIEKKLELLEINTYLRKSDVTQIIWELNKDLYLKYQIDDYKKLEYLMNAEIVTQMPHIGRATNNVDGQVYFDRYLEGSTTAVRLTYIEEQKFNKLIEDGNSDVLNYFTITSDNEMKIAYYQEEKVSLTTNDTTVDLSTYDERVTNEEPTYEISGYETRIIKYDTIIPAKYSLPFEYLWALLVMSEDYDFVKNVADLAYNSEIIISIYDNILENTIETQYTYSTNEVLYSQIKSKVTEERTEIDRASIAQIESQGYKLISDVEEKVESTTEKEEHQKKIEGIQNESEYYVKKVLSTYTNSMEIKVTYANVWIAEYKTEYNNYTDGHKYSSGTPDTTESSTEGEDTEVEKANSRKTDVEIERREINSREREVEMKFQSVSNNRIVTRKVKEKTIETDIYMGDTWIGSYSSNKDIEENTYSYSSTYIEDPSATMLKEKTNINGELDDNGNKIGENFCSLFRNSSKQSYIIDNRRWLMEILEENSETADMVDLTKYLLNIATGKNYYKLNGFNFENIFNTRAIGTLYGGSAEEQLWFALLDAGYSKIAAAGVLGNIFAESGVRADNLQNSYETKLGMTDEEYTEAVNNGTYADFINDSAGYGLAQWTSAGRKEGLYLFAQSRGTDINDSSMQIEYLLGEISQSGGADGYATFQMGTNKRGYSYSSWKDATAVDEAAMAFCYVFERPYGTDHNDRATYANMYYERYKDATELSSSIGDIELTGDNQAKMQAMLQDAIRIANDNRYGYSQENRNDEFYYDCSSLVARLYKKHFGIDVPGTTANYNSYDNYYIGNPRNIQLRPGDVLWRRNGDQGHVTLYIGNGNYVAAHSAKKPKADQITVYQDNPSNYMRVYRFIK